VNKKNQEKIQENKGKAKKGRVYFHTILIGILQIRK
jgi:hypothetical protein